MATFTKMMIVLSYLLLSTINLVFAYSSVEFFASNNTQMIDIKTAYQRLTGKEQKALENYMIKILQKNHIEQGKFTKILGTYLSASDHVVSADNSERFNTSPNQDLSEERIFSLAKELAINLNQESVAVFIPNQTMIGNITVSFISHNPSINEIINILHNMFPAFYSEGFSLHLSSTCGDFENAKVKKIEWLGSKINLNDIKKAFPKERINYHLGTAFLVFQDGTKKQL